MTAYNFKAQFADDVESGRKRQTIRVERKDGRVPREGEALQIYTGMRSKSCRKLRDAVCEFTQEVVMTNTGMKLDGVALDPAYILRIAMMDGFKTTEEFRDFFKNTHGFPFRGILIKW